MATNGTEENGTTDQPTTPLVESPPPALKDIMEAFAKTGTKPKADTPEDLTKWMIDYLKSTGAIKLEHVNPDIVLPPPPKPPPREKSSKAVERGIVGRQDVDGMLHSMLWTGLRTSLKDISGHKYDTIKEFDSLRVALRQIENDHMHREVLTKSSKPQTSKAAIEQSDAEDIKGMIQQMTTRMDRYEKKLEKQEPTQQQQEPSWQQQPS
ncbi:unnamed protein product [Mytilus edulis]|uniref:Uncharacterized protein n=1 Tax=Mytilus edulis TaxID=6550 RepID=A0A8S3UMX7_MYTED|nr:unnamed protein product [Mytilus edulis]